MIRNAALATVALALWASLAGLAQTATPAFVGTWRLDVTRSTYSPGPTPRSQTAVYTATDGGLRVAADRVEADGRTVHFDWSANFDGKDYPVTGDAGRDSVSVERVDDHHLRFINKKNGAVTTRHTLVYSNDGRSRVETIAGVNAQGQPVNNVTVWTKQ